MSYRIHQKGSTVVTSGFCKKVRDLLRVVILAYCIDAGAQADGSTHSSIPVPRAKKGPRRWQVEVGADGLLLGVARPPVSEQVRP